MGKLFGIFRIEKRQASAIGGIEAENNRTEADKDKKDFKRSDIDFDRTNQNEKIIYSPDFKQSIDDELQKYGIDKKPRSNAVVALDAFYGASPEFFEQNDKVVSDEYFRRCIDFHKRHFGHIINAVIHYDEKTPHLHVISVPIVDRGDKGFALCAKDLLNGKTILSRLQTTFNKEVSADFGLERGEVREDGERKKHLDSLDFKKQQREIEIAEREEKIEKQEQKIEKQTEVIEAKQAEIVEVEAVKAKLETEVGKLEEIKEIVKPLPFSVTQLFRNVGNAVSIAVNRLFDKIEHMKTIYSNEVRAAFCKMVSIGKRLFTPVLVGKFSLYHNGNRPVYQKIDESYEPTAIEDSDRNIRTDFSMDDWKRAFPPYDRIDWTSPVDAQQQDIIDRIDRIRDIAFGRPHEIDDLREVDEIEVRIDADGRFVRIDDKTDDDEPDYFDDVDTNRQKKQDAEKVTDGTEPSEPGTADEAFDDMTTDDVDIDNEPDD